VPQRSELLARFGSHVGESPVVIIVVEHRTFEMGKVNIFPSTVVVVAHCHSETPDAGCEARLNRHISESAVMIVAIQLAGVTLARTEIFERGTVHQENIHPSIIVVIKDGDTSAHCFHDVAFLKAAAGEVKINAGGVSDILELSGERRGRRSCVPSGGCVALTRLLLPWTRGGSPCCHEKKADYPGQYLLTDTLGDHQWTRPVAIPPDSR